MFKVVGLFDPQVVLMGTDSIETGFVVPYHIYNWLQAVLGHEWGEWLGMVKASENADIKKLLIAEVEIGEDVAFRDEGEGRVGTREVERSNEFVKCGI